MPYRTLWSRRWRHCRVCGVRTGAGHDTRGGFGPVEAAALQKYVRMVALNMPVGAIRQKMAQYGFMDKRRVLTVLENRVPPPPGPV